MSEEQGAWLKRRERREGFFVIFQLFWCVHWWAVSASFIESGQ